jgi:DNA-binding GntR family transcriptional regulator
MQTIQAPDQVRAVVKESIHEQILPVLRNDIISNRWDPGERLPEPLLCREFGISRTPLREALKILETEGLVEQRPRIGVVVTPLDPPDLADKFEVLIGFEQLAAAKVARLHHPETLDAIGKIQDLMVAAAAAGDMPRYYDLNDEFHCAIVSGASNATLAQMHRNIMWHVRRARHRVHEYESAHKTSAERHDAIITALIAGDENAAARAARVHLEDIATAVLAKVRSAGRAAHGARPDDESAVPAR